MTVFEAVLLAIVQGATEFLPISSSGHLVLGQTFLGLDEPNLLFDIILHVGTLVAVVVFYRQSLVDIVRDSWSGARRFAQTRRVADLFEGEGARIALFVLIATIPTGILGLALEKLLDPADGTRIITAPVVCAILLVNGAILISHRWLRVREPEAPKGTGLGSMTLWNFTIWGAIVIGIAQGVAVLPGISRSGTTITAALLVGSARTQAARFSFLLSIPAILGALVLKFEPSAFAEHGGRTLGLYLGAAIVAAVVGYLCLRLLVLLLEKAQFHHFAWYCWAVGIAGIIAFWVR